MAENMIEEVANILGIKLYVPFDIEDKEGVSSIYNPYMLKDDFLYDRDNHACPLALNCLLNGIYKIKKLILTPKEKAYLEGVLRPFKDRIVYIRKKCNTYLEEEKAFINARLNYYDDDKDDDDIGLPYFHKDEMYKGMELNKEYTLKELGLFVGEKDVCNKD